MRAREELLEARRRLGFDDVRVRLRERRVIAQWLTTQIPAGPCWAGCERSRLTVS